MFSCQDSVADACINRSRPFLVCSVGPISQPRLQLLHDTWGTHLHIFCLPHYDSDSTPLPPSSSSPPPPPLHTDTPPPHSLDANTHTHTHTHTHRHTVQDYSSNFTGRGFCRFEWRSLVVGSRSQLGCRSSVGQFVRFSVRAQAGKKDGQWLWGLEAFPNSGTQIGRRVDR